MKTTTKITPAKTPATRLRNPVPLARYAILACFALATAFLAVCGVMYGVEKVTGYFAWVDAERSAQYKAGYEKGQKDILIAQANKDPITMEIKGKEVWARVDVLKDESPAGPTQTEAPLPVTTDEQIETAATAAANIQTAQLKAGKKGKTD